MIPKIPPVFRRSLVLGASLFSLCFLTLPARSAVVNALKTTAALTVDGNLDEAAWTGSTFTTFTRVVSGTGNNSVDFAVLWDATYLYVGIKVTDSQLFNDTANSGTPLNVWQDDSAEVYLDASKNNGTIYDAFDRRCFVQGYNDTALANIGSATGVLHGWAPITGGYSVEMAIPWRNLGITPVGGTTTIGFDVGNNDDDGGTTRESHLLWNGQDTNSDDTSQFGDCFLSSVMAGSPPAGLNATYDHRVRASTGEPVRSNVASATTLWDTIGVFKHADLTAVENFYANHVKRPPAPKAAAHVFFGGKGDTSDTWDKWRTNGLKAINAFTPWLQGGRRLIVSCNPWPNAAWPAYNLQGANTGAGYFAEYATFFAQVKTYCDAHGINPAQLIVRPAWEFNGKFFTWTIDGTSTHTTNGVNHSEGRTTAQRTADYKKMMQDIFAAQARELPGSIRSWCLLGRKNTIGFVEAAYPGDAYVDVIDLDDYGTAATAQQPWTDAQRQIAWNLHTAVNQTPNLAWQRSFALAHGKKVGFSEWGISWRAKDKSGTEDDPLYINGMFDWMEQQLLPHGLMTLSNGDPTHACYFHVDATGVAGHLLYGLAPADAYYSPRARDAFHLRVGGTGTPQ